MKYLVSILTLLALLVGCTNPTPSDEDLICQLNLKDKQNCTDTLSLQSGELTLHAERLSFILTANYAACYQNEKVRITGLYEQRTHSKTLDIELVAKQTIMVDDGEVSDFPRTIGLVSLDTDSGKGHFVDIWATTQAYGKKDERLANADLTCQLEKSKTTL